MRTVRKQTRLRPLFIPTLRSHRLDVVKFKMDVDAEAKGDDAEERGDDDDEAEERGDDDTEAKGDDEAEERGDDDDAKESGTIQEHTVSNCPVCFSILFRPQSSICGHSICEPCLMEMRKVAQSDIISCPICNAKSDAWYLNYTIVHLLENMHEYKERQKKQDAELMKDLANINEHIEKLNELCSEYQDLRNRVKTFVEKNAKKYVVEVQKIKDKYGSAVQGTFARHVDTLRTFVNHISVYHISRTARKRYRECADLMGIPWEKDEE